jgi:5-methyltetrahydrofolate--homocysteine methyltransferase
MRIIGEKINGTRKEVATAVAGRDRDLIAALARRQVDAGAHWLDVNAGTPPEREVEDLVWLVQTVQAAVDVALCLDSTDATALAAALKAVKHTPLVNSISGEPGRLDAVLPLVAANGCDVVALAMDEHGIPPSPERRMQVIERLLAATRKAGIADERVYVDPLVLTVATNTDAAGVTLDVIRRVRAEFPQAHIVLGLSNVSFGLPARALVNRTFLTLALGAGIDTAMMDPTDVELKATLLATELLLGRDRHCLTYTRAYRAGLIGAHQPSRSPAQPRQTHTTRET